MAGKYPICLHTTRTGTGAWPHRGTQRAWTTKRSKPIPENRIRPDLHTAPHGKQAQPKTGHGNQDLAPNRHDAALTSSTKRSPIRTNNGCPQRRSRDRDRSCARIGPSGHVTNRTPYPGTHRKTPSCPLIRSAPFAGASRPGDIAIARPQAPQNINRRLAHLGSTFQRMTLNPARKVPAALLPPPRGGPASVLDRAWEW